MNRFKISKTASAVIFLLLLLIPALAFGRGYLAQRAETASTGPVGAIAPAAQSPALAVPPGGNTVPSGLSDGRPMDCDSGGCGDAAAPAGSATSQATTDCADCPDASTAPAAATKGTAKVTGQEQRLRIQVAGGYDPSTVNVKAGLPLVLEFERHETSGCSKYLVIPDLGVNVELPDDGVKEIRLDGLKAGSYRFQCGMNMLSGVIVVK